jgi:hypothetical protein
MSWEDEFRRRLKRFEKTFPTQNGDTPISIKVRVSSGCFHREHSPNAYRLIDEYLASHSHSDFGFEEHESGPELLVYLSFVAAGVSLTTSIINLVTTIIKARTEGIKRGDRKDAPLELIVRGFDEDGTLREETVLRIDAGHDVNEKLIEKALVDSVGKLAPKNKVKKKSREKK